MGSLGEIRLSNQYRSINDEFFENSEFFMFFSKILINFFFFLKSLKKQNNICLCEIILSLYDVATGPVENDLVLDNKPSKTHGRLYFSLTMLQNLHFFLIPDQIHFEFSEPKKENSYFFFLKLLVNINNFFIICILFNIYLFVLCFFLIK